MKKYIKFGDVVSELVEFNERNNPVILTDDTSGMIYNKERIRCELHDSVSWDFSTEEVYNEYISKKKNKL